MRPTILFFSLSFNAAAHKLIPVKEHNWMYFNHCPAGPGYIRFQESFNPNKMPLKLIKYSVVDA